MSIPDFYSSHSWGSTNNSGVDTDYFWNNNIN